MNHKTLTKTHFFFPDMSWLWLTIIILGIFFRCAYLGDKIYWVDEVLTSLRIAGYTQQELYVELTDKDLISFNELHQYQTINHLEKDFFTSLKVYQQHPEHAPLYFIITRVWVQFFGNSITVTRSLSIIFSILALPCFYWLCIELFESPLVGLIATAFLSVSPFYIYYAQEARPYSLWLVTILVSNLTLLRAIRLNNSQSWLLYIVASTLSYYSSILSLLIMVGQSIYVAILSQFKRSSSVYKYLLSSSLSLLLFSPWLILIIQNLQVLKDNTSWMRESIPLLAKIAIWLYGLSSVFIETPISQSFNLILFLRILIDINLFIILFFSVYFLFKKNFKTAGFFVFCTSFFYGLIIIISDLCLQGQSSTASRYMIPLYLGFQLSLAYLLTQKIFFSLNNQIKQWKLILIVIVSISIVSYSFNIQKSPKYQKTRNLSNIPIAKIVNQSNSPIIIAEKDNILDMISLSYSLKKEVKYKVVSSGSELSNYLSDLNSKQLFVLNPSLGLIEEINRVKQIELTLVYKPELFVSNELYLGIWKIKKII